MNKIFSVLILFVGTIFTTNAHTPGDDYIYECPKCSSFLKRGSNTSGNTFGATLYSDGKMIAPMLPEFPDLTKCTKCDTILWLSDMKEIGTCDVWDEKCKPKWKNADRVKFLDVNDLLRFLELDPIKNNEEKEKMIRFQVWWAFNDRIREGKDIFVQETDEALWEQNIRRLIELFDTENVNKRITAAEFHRNLGEFDECIKLISSLDDQFDWLVEKIKIECENKNKLLIKLR